MSTVVAFPPMSDDASAIGVLSTWFVESGETVRTGQVIAEVSMDKVTIDIEAPVAGVVTRLVAEEAEVTQGAGIARID